MVARGGRRIDRRRIVQVTGAAYRRGGGLWCRWCGSWRWRRSRRRCGRRDGRHRRNRLGNGFARCGSGLRLGLGQLGGSGLGWRRLGGRRRCWRRRLRWLRGWLGRRRWCGRWRNGRRHPLHGDRHRRCWFGCLRTIGHQPQGQRGMQPDRQCNCQCGLRPCAWRVVAVLPDDKRRRGDVTVTRRLMWPVA